MKMDCDVAGRGSERDADDAVVVKWFGARVSDVGAEPGVVGDGDAVERAESVENGAEGGELRRLVITAAVGSEDRKGDVIDPSGWDLEGYRRNPVFLWAHDRSLPPIGKASRVWVDGTSLRALVEFAPTAFAEQVSELYAQGFMRGVSVGFIPLETEMRASSHGRRGYWYKRQELLEISAVPVPMHSNALAVSGTSVEARDAAGLLEAREEMRRLWSEVAGLGEL